VGEHEGSETDEIGWVLSLDPASAMRPGGVTEISISPTLDNRAYV
jgi:hypothetical protein